MMMILDVVGSGRLCQGTAKDVQVAKGLGLEGGGQTQQYLEVVTPDLEERHFRIPPEAELEQEKKI